MYLPSHFEEAHVDVLHSLIRSRPLATLITMTTEGVEANHIPLQLDAGTGEFGTLCGHVARANRFWLDGPLQISAIEQTRFLAALARGGLPFPAAVQTQVREIARLEQGDGWTLYGKTGWADSYDPDLGWWVGWVAISPRFWRPGCTHLPIRVEYRHAAVCRCGQATSAGQGLSESAWSFVNLFPPGGGRA